MEKKYRDMVNTRRLYKFEEDFFELSPYRYMHVQMNKQTLVNIATVIWYDETGSLLNMPEIRFGKGLYHGTAKGIKYSYSWCDRQTIELAPTQRDLLTLIHVVTAKGFLCSTRLIAWLDRQFTAGGRQDPLIQRLFARLQKRLIRSQRIETQPKQQGRTQTDSKQTFHSVSSLRQTVKHQDVVLFPQGLGTLFCFSVVRIS